MVRIFIPALPILMLATALATSFALAQNSQGDHAAKAPSGAGSENEFKFEVLSIRPIPREAAGSLGISKPTPNGFSARILLYQAVIFAFGPPYPDVNPRLAFTDIRNLPNWSGDVYAFEARVSQADLKAWQSQDKHYDLLRSALRGALKERFKLVLHKESRKKLMNELVIAKGGPRLKAAAPDTNLPKGLHLESGGVVTGGGDEGWKFYGATIQDLGTFLSRFAADPVRDRTGLTGRYDFTLRRDPEAPKGYYPEILDSFYLQDLGLKLRPGTEDRPDLVIDHVERPTQN